MQIFLLVWKRNGERRKTAVLDHQHVIIYFFFDIFLANLQFVAQKLSKAKVVDLMFLYFLSQETLLLPLFIVRNSTLRRICTSSSFILEFLGLTQAFTDSKEAAMKTWYVRFKMVFFFILPNVKGHFFFELLVTF